MNGPLSKKKICVNSFKKNCHYLKRCEVRLIAYSRSYLASQESPSNLECSVPSGIGNLSTLSGMMAKIRCKGNDVLQVCTLVSASCS